MISKISKSEQQRWQAEDDARILATYQEILNDKARMDRAVKAAQKQADDLNKRAAAMSNAAKVRNTKTGKKK